MKAKHSGIFSRTEIRKRNRDIHTKKGLCRTCSRKVKKGRLYCQYHLDFHKKANKRKEWFPKLK